MKMKFPNPRWYFESNSKLPFLLVLKKLILIIIIIWTIPFTACQKNNEQERPEKVLNKQYSPQSQLSASELEDFATMAIKIGNVSRAIEQWGRAEAIYKIQGKQYDQARCLANRARAFAAIDRHEEAFKEVNQAKSLIDLVDIKDRLYHNILGVLQREQKLLEMIVEYKNQKSKSPNYQSSSSIRPQTLILAKKLLNDYGFRRSFLMDKAEPKSFPNQVKTALELNDIELNALCVYGYNVHVNYHELLKKKYPNYMGSYFELSPGFLAVIGNHLKEADSLVKQLEQKIGSEPSIDDE